MNYVKHLAGTVLAVFLSIFISRAQSYNISDTRYDYSNAARQITAGCSTRYEQAKAIYRWLCRNISYDTSYSIYTADECWDSRTGVCQAYCELFYRLAEPLGIKTYIITGDTKKSVGEEIGHAWVFAVVEGDGTGILIDPTWGAGSVDGKVFKRSDNDMTWFHVDPSWMIFSHFPDDDIFQFIDNRLSVEQFLALPDIRPVWGEYGYDAKEMLEYCMANRNDMPELNNNGVGKVLLVDMPLQKELRIGSTYSFSFGKLENCDVRITNGDDLYDGWTVSSSGIYSMNFTLYTPGNLTLSIKGNDGAYWSFVQYEVPEPTRSDLARLKNVRPLAMPQITELKNADLRKMEELGIDGEELLSQVLEGKVRTLPVFYTFNNGCRIVDMPYSGILESGVQYTFTIIPEDDSQWALVNGDTWFSEWTEISGSHALTMTVIPKNPGELLLVVNSGSGNNYEYCLKYIVR